MPGSGKIEEDRTLRSYVVDASVVARWFIKGEEWEDNALKRLDDYKTGRVELFSVSLLFYEVANSLWKAVKRKYISKDDAIMAIEQLPILAPHTINFSEEDWKEVLKVALRLRVTTYDSSYLVASMKKNAPLITADQDLVKKVEGFDILELKDY